MSGVRRDVLEVLEFAVLMAREFPTAPGLPGRLAYLIRFGKRHAKYAEANCNRGLTAAEERAEAKLCAKIMEACREINPGCVPVFSGDPRGSTVKLKVPSGAANDWGREGVCVPGS